MKLPSTASTLASSRPDFLNSLGYELPINGGPRVSDPPLQLDADLLGDGERIVELDYRRC
jgi:hypothetical protein